MATIAYCAIDMPAQVYIDTGSYLGHQQNLKMTPHRLSFEQYLFIATNQYLFVEAIGVRLYRSIPVGQCNRFAKVSIDSCRQFNPFPTGNPFLGTKVLGFSTEV